MIREELKKYIEDNILKEYDLNESGHNINHANYVIKRSLKFAENLDVNKEMVYVDTPFFSKDMSVVWIKNNKNEIKAYELNEIVPKDERDIKIDFLLAQIEELKKGMRKDESYDVINESITKSNEDEKPSNVSNVSKSAKKSK